MAQYQNIGVPFFKIREWMGQMKEIGIERSTAEGETHQGNVANESSFHFKTSIAESLIIRYQFVCQISKKKKYASSEVLEVIQHKKDNVIFQIVHC